MSSARTDDRRVTEDEPGTHWHRPGTNELEIEVALSELIGATWRSAYGESCQIDPFDRRQDVALRIAGPGRRCLGSAGPGTARGPLSPPEPWLRLGLSCPLAETTLRAASAPFPKFVIRLGML
jgi:hypothetical protein